MTDTAKLVFTIQSDSDFVAVFTTVPPPGQPPQYTTAALSMTPNPQFGVTLSADGKTVTVANGVDLNFKINAGTGSAYKYKPVGIALKAAGDPDPIGGRTFPQTIVVGSGLTLTDTDLDKHTYNFLLCIQRSDGAFGVIDPRISNT